MDRSRNRKWNLVRERAWTTVLSLEGWYSEHPCVWRRADLLGRNAKVKKVWKVDECLMTDDLKAKQRQFVFYPLLKKLTIGKNILTTALLGIKPMTFLPQVQWSATELSPPPSLVSLSDWHQRLQPLSVHSLWVTITETIQPVSHNHWAVSYTHLTLPTNIAV